jgi:iron complex transport system substrate-binding protein
VSVSGDRDLEALVTTVVDHGFRLHQAIGPGLLESAYEAFLTASLREAGLKVDQQLVLPATYRGFTVENAFRLDLLIENVLIVEIKSVETLAKVHSKQLLTYLRLTNMPLGLLINFGTEFYLDGIKRIINNNHTCQRPNP